MLFGLCLLIEGGFALLLYLEVAMLSFCFLLGLHSRCNCRPGDLASKGADSMVAIQPQLDVVNVVALTPLDMDSPLVA